MKIILLIDYYLSLIVTPSIIYIYIVYVPHYVSNIW